MSISVKICGLTDEAAVEAAVHAGADHIGFVYFPPSPRHLPLQRAAQLKCHAGNAHSVAVLVDADDALLAEVKQVLAPHAVQLHGKESPARVREVKALLPGTTLIKAISVREGDDVAKAKAYEGLADLVLFDARAPKGSSLPGGNGLAFDWVLLKGRQFGFPWVLSGGLTPENVGLAIAETGARFVDVSSGVEAAPGVKDAALIHDFVKAARAHDQAKPV